MKGYAKRKKIPGQAGTRVTIAVDKVTHVAVKALMERDGLSYSAGICALATASAIREPELMAVIKAMIADSVRDSMDDTGYHPALSRELARELVTGHTQPHPDYPMPGLDGEAIDGHVHK